MRGFYSLILELPRSARLTVGRLGTFPLPSGWYIYCGSALNGVEGRVARHCRPDRKQHWHIDYLLPAARLVEVWVGPSEERLECLCAAVLAALPGNELVVPHFGASDCCCPGHLVSSAARPDLTAFAEALAQRLPGVQLHRLSPHRPAPSAAGVPTGPSRRAV